MEIRRVAALSAPLAEARVALDVEWAWQRYGSAMLGLAMLVCGSRVEAEDVVQDVFAELSRKPRMVGDVEGYLRVAVLNRCRRRRRRSWREVTGAGAEERAGDGAEFDATLQCVLALRPRYRAAIVLRFYQDLSMADVAAALGCRESTARSLVHRGLRQLKEMLA